MNSYKRTYLTQTRSELLLHARRLFAERGFRGTTVRAIAASSGANLGAVAYHFGSKRGLYEEVIDEVTAPIRDRLSRSAATHGSALDGIEAYVRATFAFLAENPDVPRLVLQQLVTGDPLPRAAAQTLQMNVQMARQFIERGQREGTIRAGDPRFLALSFVGQPMFLAIYRKALDETIHLDPMAPETRGSLIDTVVEFVRRALSTEEAS